MASHTASKRAEALFLLRDGVPHREVAEQLGVPRGTVGWWRSEDRRARGEEYRRPTDCPRCAERAVERTSYSYLLGLCLGDGHIISKPCQHHLSVYCDARYTGLVAAAEDAMRTVLPSAATGRRSRNGCVEVKSYTQHWKCLFPQHGALFTGALDALGITWTVLHRDGKPYNISVARKASVALLDLHVGPKY
ncbi:helix-turn-helix domain-containing protein [Streptomyces seoulensis]|uniref:helix-turn-helix domain-containing protein n=1 Tax=Streptomyces seoulensis TaxID=73044 RepID=UPI003C2C41DB